jgi:hypothetical protein
MQPQWFVACRDMASPWLNDPLPVTAQLLLGFGLLAKQSQQAARYVIPGTTYMTN